MGYIGCSFLEWWFSDLYVGTYDDCEKGTDSRNSPEEV